MVHIRELRKPWQIWKCNKAMYTSNLTKLIFGLILLFYKNSTTVVCTNTQQPEYQSGHYSMLRFFPSLTYYLALYTYSKLLYNQLEIKGPRHKF